MWRENGNNGTKRKIGMSGQYAPSEAGIKVATEAWQAACSKERPSAGPEADRSHKLLVQTATRKVATWEECIIGWVLATQCLNDGNKEHSHTYINTCVYCVSLDVTVYLLRYIN
jgi:hypothetical protein